MCVRAGGDACGTGRPIETLSSVAPTTVSRARCPHEAAVDRWSDWVKNRLADPHRRPHPSRRQKIERFANCPSRDRRLQRRAGIRKRHIEEFVFYPNLADGASSSAGFPERHAAAEKSSPLISWQTVARLAHPSADIPQRDDDRYVDCSGAKPPSATAPHQAMPATGRRRMKPGILVRIRSAAVRAAVRLTRISLLVYQQRIASQATSGPRHRAANRCQAIR